MKKSYPVMRIEEDEIQRIITDSRWYKLYLRYIYPVEYVLSFLLKTIFAYGFIIVGKKTNHNLLKNN